MGRTGREKKERQPPTRGPPLSRRLGASMRAARTRRMPGILQGAVSLARSPWSAIGRLIPIARRKTASQKNKEGPSPKETGRPRPEFHFRLRCRSAFPGPRPARDRKRERHDERGSFMLFSRPKHSQNHSTPITGIHEDKRRRQTIPISRRRG